MKYKYLWLLISLYCLFELAVYYLLLPAIVLTFSTCCFILCAHTFGTASHQLIRCYTDVSWWWLAKQCLPKMCTTGQQSLWIQKEMWSFWFQTQGASKQNATCTGNMVFNMSEFKLLVVMEIKWS